MPKIYTDDGEEFFEVENILECRRKKGVFQYYVRWKGYGETYDTWEPDDNFSEEAMGLVEEIKREFLEDEANKKRKKLDGKREAKATKRLVPASPRATGRTQQSASDEWSKPATVSPSRGTNDWNSSPSGDSLPETSTPGGWGTSPGGWGTPAAESSWATTPVDQGGWTKTSTGSDSGSPARKISTDWNSITPLHGSSPVDEGASLVFPSLPTKPKKAAAACSRHILHDTDKVEIIGICQDQFLLRALFGERVKIVRRQFTQSDAEPLEKELEIDGTKYYLIARKSEKGDDENNRFSVGGTQYDKRYYKAYYLEGSDTIGVQEELELYANFAGLSPRQIASRLELLVSPARWDRKLGHPYIFKFDSSKDFENIEENGHLGCGFIPTSWLSTLLPNNPSPVYAIQVRLVGPKQGIYKGVLVAKNNISLVQLPDSMKKVGPSTQLRRSGEVYMLINGVFPSQKSSMLDRNINPKTKKQPTRSSERELKCPGYMIQRVLFENNVPYDAWLQYSDSCRSWNGLGHWSCVGVRDPTDSLPSNSVFVSGLGVSKDGDLKRKVLVTRFPCTEKGDARLLNCITSKPRVMSKEDWRFLTDLPSGMIFFPAPSERDPEIPPQIADGDLDGDHFMVFWDSNLLSYINDPVPLGTSEMYDKEATEIDELVDSTFRLYHEGKLRNATVVNRGETEGKYVVQVDHHHIELSRDEILADRGFVEKILQDRHSGSSLEVEVQWSDGSPNEWHAVHDAVSGLRDEIPFQLAEYAAQKGILNQKSWEWAKQYLLEPVIEMVLNHHPSTKAPVRVEVRWDDASTSWKNLSDIDKENPPEALIAYVQENENGDSQCEWPEWLEDKVNDAETNWFANAQKVVADTRRLIGIDTLTKWLHKVFEEETVKGFEAVLVGRAYKQSLDITKHGGRVTVPMSLHRKTPKQACKHVKFQAG